jgi:hypothetical protein
MPHPSDPTWVTPTTTKWRNITMLCGTFLLFHLISILNELGSLMSILASKSFHRILVLPLTLCPVVDNSVVPSATSVYPFKVLSLLLRVIVPNTTRTQSHLLHVKQKFSVGMKAAFKFCRSVTHIVRYNCIWWHWAEKLDVSADGGVSSFLFFPSPNLWRHWHARIKGPVHSKDAKANESSLSRLSIFWQKGNIQLFSHIRHKSGAGTKFLEGRRNLVSHSRQ